MMMSDRTDLHCPVCRSASMILEEISESSSSWQIVAGRFSGELSHAAGIPLRVEASCTECGHVWRLRGVRKMDDLVTSQH